MRFYELDFALPTAPAARFVAELRPSFAVDGADLDAVFGDRAFLRVEMPECFRPARLPGVRLPRHAMPAFLRRREPWQRRHPDAEAETVVPVFSYN